MPETPAATTARDLGKRPKSEVTTSITSLINLSHEQLCALTDRQHTAPGRGNATERDLAAAVALVAMAAAVVLAFVGG